MNVLLYSTYYKYVDFILIPIVESYTHIYIYMCVHVVYVDLISIPIVESYTHIYICVYVCMLCMSTSY